MIRLITLTILTGQLVSAQVIQGSVRTSDGQFVAGAVVTLSAATIVTTRTDAGGTYQLQAMGAGTYSLRVQVDGYEPGTVGPLVLAATDVKNIDVTLKPLEAEFFDQPSFIVAGVADTTAHGGHGSDTLLRSTETLAKATASLGNVTDKENALDAAREYQHLAEVDPSERHLFDWGSELLLHRATNQAIEVFTKGARLFSESTRMLIGLAVAWYTNGSDDNASHYFFAACDLHPNDPIPYDFLGKVESAAITSSDGYLERLARSAKLDPQNPQANYFYAASLWKQRRPDDLETQVKVQTLLEKAIRLDPNCSPAYLQLGILYSDQKDSVHAIAAYRKADVDEAHYRLALEYKKLGENKKAQEELATYNELSKKSSDEAAHERKTLQQFVFELREPK